jgi:hypothetical protein
MHLSSSLFQIKQKFHLVQDSEEKKKVLYSCLKKKRKSKDSELETIKQTNSSPGGDFMVTWFIIFRVSATCSTIIAK